MGGSLPYPLPSGYNAAGPYRNPGQTIPSPLPTDMPVGLWRGERISQDSWTANPPDDPAIRWRLEWASPVFDMRPDLRSTSENRSNNTGPNGVPIWGGNAWASGVHLWLDTQMLGQNAPFVGQPDYRGVEVLLTEEAHPMDLTQLTTILPFQDVTASFANAGQSNVTIYSPWGTGNPIRYWRLRLRFQIRNNTTFVGPLPPVLVTQAAMY